MTDLNHKTYYAEQTSDMLYELLLKLKSDTVKDVEKNAVVEDIDFLVEHITQPSISLELFIDLAHYMKNHIICLFNIVETEVPSSILFSKLYSLLRELDSHGVQKEMMEEIFDKYGKMALLSGLNYFLENVSEPEYTYYSYHLQAANFLKLNDYKSQTEYKMQTRTLFTKEDLLSYYSDTGSNKYSKKGRRFYCLVIIKFLLLIYCRTLKFVLHLWSTRMSLMLFFQMGKQCMITTILRPSKINSTTA